MTEALKCPSCSAPLEAPSGNATSMRCPYCNTTVMLRGDSAPTTKDSPRGPGVAEALQKDEILRLVRDGRKIEAIKLYRETYNIGLAAAKNAVEQMAASTNTLPGTPKTTPAKTASSAAKFGILMTVAVLIFTSIILSIVGHSTHVAQSPTLTTPAYVPPSPVVEPPQPLTPPSPPAYADMKLEFGSDGIGAGQFKDARSVAIDNTGKIYVGEYSDGRIQVFDQTGKFLSLWSLGKGQYLLDLAADHQGNLYVVTAEKITRYDAKTLTPQNDFETATDPESYDRETYSDVCPALDGNVYAVGGTHIIVLTPQGKITKVYKEADAIGQDVDFDRVAVSGEGDIYAMVRNMGLVFKFAPNGHFITRFGGGDGSGLGSLTAAQNIAVDGQGRVLICGGNPAISVFDADGRFVNSFGGFDFTAGIAVNDQNEIFASFRNRHTVRMYVINKQPAAFP